MRTMPGASARAATSAGRESRDGRDPASGSPSPPTRLTRLGPWALAVLGAAGAFAATAARPSAARAAAAQDWSPFVLVAGLLLIGLVADDDGLFAAAGHRLARLTRHGSALFIGAAVIIGVVTAVLNLDTSVAFLTPVLIYLA